MHIAFYGDSLTAGMPGASYFTRLRERLPEHVLFNFGQVNDTPLSLYRRIVRQRLLPPVDLAFVWVGVNDLLIGRSWFFSRFRRQWARDDDHFCQHYRALLDLLSHHARQVVAVSPVFVGENLRTPLNQALAHRADLIRQLCADYRNVQYLDVRAAFVRELDSNPPPALLPQNGFQSARDALLLHTDAQIDQAAARRGLRFTLDGVHLNSRGAQVVAGAFQQVIERFDRQE